MIHESETTKLKALCKKLAPSVWIGKNGVDEFVVSELRNQLTHKKVVKAKILRNALRGSSRRKIAKHLERASGAPLIDLKGCTAVYSSPYRRREEASHGFTF